MTRKVGTGVKHSDGDGLQPAAVFVWSTVTDAVLAYAAVVALIAGLVVALWH